MATTVYSFMKFPEYQFQEYPKWVRREGHPDVLVNNAEEEAELLGDEEDEGGEEAEETEVELEVEEGLLGQRHPSGKPYETEDGKKSTPNGRLPLPPSDDPVKNKKRERAAARRAAKKGS